MELLDQCLKNIEKREAMFGWKIFISPNPLHHSPRKFMILNSLSSFLYQSLNYMMEQQIQLACAAIQTTNGDNSDVELKEGCCHVIDVYIKPI